MMNNKTWSFSQDYSALQGFKRIMRVVLKRGEPKGNQDLHYWF